MNEQKIRFYHLRWFSDYAYLNHYMTPLEKGGVTVAVKTLDGGTFEYGVAYCHINDAYCRKTGREMALSMLTDKPEKFDMNDYPGWFRDDQCNRSILAKMLSLMLFVPPPSPYGKWCAVKPYKHHLGMVKFGYVCR